MAPIVAVLDTHFEKTAVKAKRVALEEVLLQQMQLLGEDEPVPVSKRDESELEARRFRYFRGIKTMVGDKDGQLTRIAALSKLLDDLPASTLQAALPGPFLYDIIASTEKQLVFDIQKSYEISTCLNVKIKNHMAWAVARGTDCGC